MKVARASCDILLTVALRKLSSVGKFGKNKEMDFMFTAVSCLFVNLLDYTEKHIVFPVE